MPRPHPDTSPNLDTSPKLDTSRAGFTLIEIAVVLVILALAYGLVTPAFSNFVAATRLESATRELAMALKEARVVRTKWWRARIFSRLATALLTIPL